ncbi:MAG: hemerythrin domain-containing protein [Thermoleophilaceae bacterium]
MKRSPALTALSRDHHHALVVAQRLTRAQPESADAATRGFLAFWQPEGQTHFRLEEEVLLPAYAAYGDPSHPAVVQTLVDHIVIRRDAQIVERDPTLASLIALGVRLAAHVRHEERRLFPLIEQAVPAPELQALAHRLDSPT